MVEEEAGPDRPAVSGEHAGYLGLLRRVPRQQRGRDKVARILDAAEELLIEVGYDVAVASPTLLIERAKVSGGSFYTYFTSPEGAVEAVALRFMEEAKARADGLVVRTYPDWQSAATVFFDTFVDYYGQAAVRELWIEGHLSRVGREADAESNAYLARILQTMVEATPVSVEASEPIRYLVAVEIYDYVMRLAFRSAGQNRADLLREAKHAFLVYLGSPATEH